MKSSFRRLPHVSAIFYKKKLNGIWKIEKVIEKRNEEKVVVC
jgi:hypothetical protein